MSEHPSQPPEITGGVISIDDATLTINEYFESFKRSGFNEKQSFKLAHTLFREQVRSELGEYYEVEIGEDDD